MVANDYNLTAPEAEAYVVGCLMVAVEKMPTVRALVAPEDFSDIKLRTVYQTLIDLSERKLPYSLPAAVERMRANCTLEAVGGRDELVRLSSLGFLPAHISHCARIVADSAALRRICAEADTLKADAQEVRGWDHSQVSEFAAEAAQRLKALADRVGATGVGVTAADVLDAARLDALKPADERPICSFALIDLDAFGPLLARGRLVVVGATPGSGKSTLLLHSALEAARQGRGALLVSLEMTAREIADRITSHEAAKPVPLGGFSPDAYGYAARDEAARRLRIYTEAGLTMLGISRLAKDALRADGTDLLVVDYLQLLQLGHKAENRQQEVAAIARGLKQIALDLDITIIAAAQLNRQVREREEPMLAHLKESGEIEAAADVVLLLWPDADPSPRLNVKVAKHRGGRTGTTALDWRRETYTLRNTSILGENWAAIQAAYQG